MDKNSTQNRTETARFRVLRGILDLQTSWSGWRAEQDRRGLDPWAATKRQIRRTFERDPDAYRCRLQRIVEQALSTNSNALVLPSCSLPCQTRRDLVWFEELFAGFSLVVAGALSWRGGALRSLGHVYRDGKLLDVFDPDLSEIDVDTVNGVPVVRCISTSVKRVREGIVDYAISRSDETAPIVILDAAHHQYAPRALRIFRGAVGHLHDVHRRPTTFCLAYWRFGQTRRMDSYPWVESSSSSSWTYSRIALEEADHFDTVDVIDIAG